jgi:DNA-binding transcriptional regulator GbsR (MarR family)
MTEHPSLSFKPEVAEAIKQAETLTLDLRGLSLIDQTQLSETINRLISATRLTLQESLKKLNEKDSNSQEIMRVTEELQSQFSQIEGKITSILDLLTVKSSVVELERQTLTKILTELNK